MSSAAVTSHYLQLTYPPYPALKHGIPTAEEETRNSRVEQIDSHYRGIVLPLFQQMSQHKRTALLPLFSEITGTRSDVRYYLLKSKDSSCYLILHPQDRDRELKKDRAELEKSLEKYNEAVARFFAEATKPLTDEEIQQTEEYHEIRASIAYSHQRILRRYQRGDGGVAKMTAYQYETSGPHPKSHAEIEASYTRDALAEYRATVTAAHPSPHEVR